MNQKIEKTLTIAALCYLVRDGEVLLAKKTRKIGAGCWNGYGGGPENGETLEQAAVRELREETRGRNGRGGVIADPRSLAKVAILDMENRKTDGSVFNCQVHVYFVRDWTGEPNENEEMVTPTWFPITQIPLDELMPADKVWLPIVLAGKKILVRAAYGPFQQKLLSEVEVQEVENFES